MILSITNIPKQTVATVLERELDPTIKRWIDRVSKVPDLTAIPLDFEARTGHLPRLLRDLVTRLRMEGDSTNHKDAPPTTSAHDHGKVRFDQGYSVSLLVEESRLLQVSLFETLRMNQKYLDTSVMMLDVMTIADECDRQLKHTVETFMDLERERLEKERSGLAA